MLAGDILRRAACRFPERTALIDGERQISYAALDAAADRCAAALAAHGCAKGDRVAILARDCLEFPIVFYGAARAGVVLATVSPRATADEIAYILAKIGARGLFYAQGMAPRAVAAKAAVPALDLLVTIHTQGGPAGAVGFSDFMAGGGMPPAVTLSEEDLLAMTFTGGTTGLPKAVVVSHRARYQSAVAAAVEFGIDERDTVVVAAPLVHTVGLFVTLQPALMLGTTVVLQPLWEAGMFMELVERYRITAGLCVPTQLADLIAHPGFDPRRLDSLRVMNHAGSPMPLALHDRLTELLPRMDLIEHYGASETGPLTVRRPFHGHAKRGSVGRPAHNVELRIFRADGTECAAGEVGELATRGEHLLNCYYDEPEQTAALYKGAPGWLWTGDLGYRDPEGFIWLVDRSKDIIISSGENIYPAEIEAVLNRHPAVAESAAFGIPDDRLGEAPAIHVVLKPGAAVEPAALRAFAAPLLARHKLPGLIEVVPALPKTAIGKIQRTLIRGPYWAGRDRPI